MKRQIAIILCILLIGGILAMPVSALSYHVSHYEEAIYAGGVVDLYAYPSEGDPVDYTYQWQYDAGFGDGHWYDVPDNENYSGGKTNHLQVHTSTGNYDGWEEIPFQCVVTSADGTVRRTANIYMYIYPTDKLIPNMKNWGFGLYEPHVDNAIDLYTKDYLTYTAAAYAGAKLGLWCGHKPVDQKPVLRKSEVELNVEIHITENGHTTVTGNQTTYIPYTVGDLKVEFRERLTIGKFDLGYFDTKTVNLTVSKPNTLYTAQAKSDCSLLRYTYNESAKLASIPKGTTLEICGTEGSYYQVYYNGFVGYVGKDLVGTTTDATDKLITNVDLTIPKPVAGQSPAATCTLETPGCALYHIQPVTWTDGETGKEIKSTEKFQEGKKYNVDIWVAAESGYRFQTDAAGNPKLTGSINGNLPPFINKAYEQDPEQVVCLTYSFGSTPAAPETPEPTVATQLPQATQPPVTPPQIHTHTPSPWRTTGAYHYKACTTCGDFLTAEDHKGGKATCAASGTCTVCNYAYLEATETHVPDTETFIACGKLYHAYLCKLCGAHCDPQDHTPGPEATDTTAQSCTVCGYVLQPAKNHVHDLIHTPFVAATCQTTGMVEHYACSGCSALFADQEGKKQLPEGTNVITPYLPHETAEDWGTDGQFHWRSCQLCQTLLEETRMAHETENGKCATCGYGGDSGQTPSGNIKETAPQTSPSATAGQSQDTAKENGDGKGSNPWSMILPVVLVCFGAAITVTVIILKIKKKEDQQ